MECVNLCMLVETLDLNWIWTLVQAWTFRLTDNSTKGSKIHSLKRE